MAKPERRCIPSGISQPSLGTGRQVEEGEHLEDGFPAYSSVWGDKNNYGNRGERYLAGVAFLEGADKQPSAVMCRGYYTRSYLWAVDFDGKELKNQMVPCFADSQRLEGNRCRWKGTEGGSWM